VEGVGSDVLMGLSADKALIRDGPLIYQGAPRGYASAAQADAGVSKPLDLFAAGFSADCAFFPSVPSDGEIRLQRNNNNQEGYRFRSKRSC
jgi:hypothetical protein